MANNHYACDQVAAAVKKGWLIKPNKCSKCGAETRILAHHEDYSKPLYVIWVCQACHKKIHRGAPISQGKLISSQFLLPDETWEYLRQTAFEQKISIAELIRHIIDKWRGGEK